VPGPLDPRMLLLVVLSGGLGWMLLDPVLAETVGMPGTTPARRRELARAAFAELMGLLPAGSTALTEEEARAAAVPRPAPERCGGAILPASRPADAPRPPRGREQVTRALLDAAMELFALRGPAAVSVREVAARARVNHALVFRHFGSKDGLVKAVWERVVEDLGGRVGGVPDYPGMVTLTEALAESETTWRLLARALLDGQAGMIASSGYPFLEVMVEAAARGQAEGLLRGRVHPRVIVAMVIAMGLGWLVYHPVLQPLLGLPLGDAAQQRAELRETAGRLLGWVGTPSRAGRAN